MHPIFVAVLAAGLHFSTTLATIVIGTGPLFRRGEAGVPPTRYDRGVATVMRVLTSPVLRLTDRYPGLMGRTGWPREHLLLAANSALWGIAAGVLAWLT